MAATKQITPRPFLKWAGGKRQLIDQYAPLWPPSFRGYLEPFVGGGAVFFWLCRWGRLDNSRLVWLNDANADLINCYQVVRDDPVGLLSELRDHTVAYLSRGREAYYYRVRAWDRMAGYIGRPPTQRAARMIFLNRTGYNGLYRVNRRGEFNVPHGDYRNPKIADKPNIWAVHRALHRADLSCGDYSAVKDWALPDDFVYLDPPYYAKSETANFTAYTPGGFEASDHLALAELYRELDRRGCLLALSNSDMPAIRDLYRGFRIETVTARRAINSNGKRRGAITELLILNY